MKKTKMVQLSAGLCIALTCGILLSGCGGADSAGSGSVYADQQTGKPVFIMAGKV